MHNFCVRYFSLEWEKIAFGLCLIQSVNIYTTLLIQIQGIMQEILIHRCAAIFNSKETAPSFTVFYSSIYN